ncbi:hypothetical protein [Salininema proteolyticum]|uniref:Molecular chaperone DnaJ n=1 Tax=Salininema proteolyticum TaxID=1607685 RepID=A0ABV8TX92_9ACTN
MERIAAALEATTRTEQRRATDPPPCIRCDGRGSFAPGVDCTDCDGTGNAHVE